MFGLSQLFLALKSLTDEINRTTSLFSAANGDLEQRLRIDATLDDERPTLPGPNGAGMMSRRAKKTIDG